MSRGLRITSLSAFIVDEDGEEGLVAELVGDTWVPFIAANHAAHLEQLRARVVELAKQTRKTIKLVRFVRGQLLEEFRKR